MLDLPALQKVTRPEMLCCVGYHFLLGGPFSMLSPGTFVMQPNYLQGNNRESDQKHAQMRTLVRLERTFENTSRNIFVVKSEPLMKCVDMFLLHVQKRDFTLCFHPGPPLQSCWLTQCLRACRVSTPRSSSPSGCSPPPCAVPTWSYQRTSASSAKVRVHTCMPWRGHTHAWTHMDTHTQTHTYGRTYIIKINSCLPL